MGGGWARQFVFLMLLAGGAAPPYNGIIWSDGTDLHWKNDAGLDRILAASTTGAFVDLQATTPGTAQTGHAHISGSIIADSITLDSTNQDVEFERLAAEHAQVGDGASNPIKLTALEFNLMEEAGFALDGSNTQIMAMNNPQTANFPIEAKAFQARSVPDSGDIKGILEDTYGLEFGSDMAIGWSATTSTSGAADVGFARNAAGIVEVTDGGVGFGDAVVDANLYFGGTTLKLGTFASRFSFDDGAIGNAFNYGGGTRQNWSTLYDSAFQVVTSYNGSGYIAIGAAASSTPPFHILQPSDSAILWHDATTTDGTFGSNTVDTVLERFDAGIVDVSKSVGGAADGAIRASDFFIDDGVVLMTTDGTNVDFRNSANDATHAITYGLFKQTKTEGVGAPYAITATEGGSLFDNRTATAEVHFDLPAAVTAAGQLYHFYVQDADGIQVNAATGDTIRISGSVTSAAGDVNSTTIGSALTLASIDATEWVALSSVGTWVVTP